MLHVNKYFVFYKFNKEAERGKSKRGNFKISRSCLGIKGWIDSGRIKERQRAITFAKFYKLTL